MNQAITEAIESWLKTKGIATETEQWEETFMSVVVKTNRHKNLFYRIYVNRLQLDEGTGWSDNARNRAKAEGQAISMTEEMEAGTFNYLEWFPAGKHLDLFRPKPADALTVQQYYDEWIPSQVEPFVRKKQGQDYRGHFNRYILNRFGGYLLNDLQVFDLAKGRTFLVTEYVRRNGKIGVTMKTCMNIYSSFAALCRDAKVNGKAKRNVFTDLPENWWPELPPPTIDPFTEDEVAEILDYYLHHRSYRAYAYCHFRAWTGVRPSEGTFLKWGSMDLQLAKAEIRGSRVRESENSPKTFKSRRTIDLLPNVVAVLTRIMPLKWTPDTHVFLDDEGKVLNQDRFSEDFQAVLRVLKIRPRDFKNLRHSFISLNLMEDPNKALWICEQVGTSLKMLKDHYGKYMRTDGASHMLAYLERKKIA